MKIKHCNKLKKKKRKCQLSAQSDIQYINGGFLGDISSLNKLFRSLILFSFALNKQMNSVRKFPIVPFSVVDIGISKGQLKVS